MGVPDLTFEVNLLRGSELTPESLRPLSFLQASDRRLDSPYFSAGFVSLVASLGDNVRVGFAHRGDQVVGVFPFQARDDGSGEPLGHPASDFHGVLTLPGVRLNAAGLLRGCGLRFWDFHHLLAHQELFRPYHSDTRPAHYIDLTKGFVSYVRERREWGTRQILQIESSRRRLEAEIGKLQFVAHSAEPGVLARLLEWKEERFRLKGIRKEISSWLWTLLQVLSQTHLEGFAGMLSTLVAGSELVAAHIGMRSRTRWHYWYPAFDPRFARYQPGLVLLLEIARHAPLLGVTRIDLGTGDEPYKARLANGYEILARGRVAVGES